MAVRVRCPHPECGKTYRVAEERLGQTATCKQCGHTFTLQALQADTIYPLARDTTGPESPDAADPGIPQQIGRFKIHSRIGSGAFGTVYRAHDPVLDRDVALKVPRAAALEKPEARARFLREPKAAAQLRHPNIVPVYDAGVDGDRYYIASAYIEGRTLEDVIADERPDFRRTARIVADLAIALDYAHRAGVIHRDVKPANVMIEERGQALLMDFGLARVESLEEKLTQDGSVMGTPAYRAPEQADRSFGEVGPASDQYSLGVVLYELLCGEPPFSGPPTVLLYNAVHQEPPAPRSIDPEIPRDLETVCLKAIAKEPKARYRNCGVLADDLRRWLADRPIRARATTLVERTWRWCRRNRIAAISIATALLLLMAALVIALRSGGTSAPLHRQTATSGTAGREPPSEPKPTPAEPEPTPLEPEPTPAEPEPMPLELEPAPLEREPTPTEPHPPLPAAGISREDRQPLRWLGYGISECAAIEEVASYTNVIWTGPSQDGSDDVIRAAHQRGVRVVLRFECKDGLELEQIEERVVDVARRNADAVVAICWEVPYFSGHQPGDLAAFGQRLKKALPSVEFWCNFTPIAKGRVQPLPIPSEVDAVMIEINGVATPVAAKAKAAEVLPAWIRKANGRPVLLLWWCGAGPRRPQGLVPKCEPETMSALGQIAQQFGLKGLFFVGYGTGSKGQVGIRTNPKMVSEIRQIARDWGIGSPDVPRTGVVEDVPVEPEIAPQAQSVTNSDPAVRAPDRDSVRWLGYEVYRATPIAQIADHANLVSFYPAQFPQGGDVAFDAARKAGLKVVAMLLAGDENRDQDLTKLIAAARRNEDVVLAICRKYDQFENVSSSDLSEVGRRVKSSVPGAQFWCVLPPNPKKEVQPESVPEEVDGIILMALHVTSAEKARACFEDVLPRWKRGLGGRPIVLMWSNWSPKKEGLIPECQPKTFREFGRLVERHSLSGLILATYGSHGKLGVEANPTLLSEVREIAEKWHIGRAGSAP